MEYRQFNDTYVVRLERGEELLSCLRTLAEKEDISLASIEGLGAADHIVIGLYDVKNQYFHRYECEQPLEISSINGNITRMNDEVYLHVHANFADQDMKVIGGHVNECRISATCELFIRKLDGKVGRFKDEETGLNLFQF